MKTITKFQFKLIYSYLIKEYQLFKLNWPFFIFYTYPAIIFKIRIIYILIIIISYLLIALFSFPFDDAFSYLFDFFGLNSHSSGRDISNLASSSLNNGSDNQHQNNLSNGVVNGNNPNGNSGLIIGQVSSEDDNENSQDSDMDINGVNGEENIFNARVNANLQNFRRNLEHLTVDRFV
jgi:hypothetical protein